MEMAGYLMIYEKKTLLNWTGSSPCLSPLLLAWKRSRNSGLPKILCFRLYPRLYCV